MVSEDAKAIVSALEDMKATNKEMIKALEKAKKEPEEEKHLAHEIIGCPECVKILGEKFVQKEPEDEEEEEDDLGI